MSNKMWWLRGKNLFNLPVFLCVHTSTRTVKARNGLRKDTRTGRLYRNLSEIQNATKKYWYILCKMTCCVFFWCYHTSRDAGELEIRCVHQGFSIARNFLITRSTFYLWAVHEQPCNTSTCLDSSARKLRGQKLDLDSKTNLVLVELRISQLCIKSLQNVREVTPLVRNFLY